MTPRHCDAKVHDTMSDNDRPSWESSPGGVASVLETEAVGSAADGLSPTGLASLLLSVGESIADVDDLAEALQRVAKVTHSVIDGADSVSITVDFGRRTYTAAYTDDRTLRVDHQQYGADEGPCLHAARTREMVLVDLGEAAERWPDFTESARAEGIRSFLAAPLHVAEHTLGALNLYGRARGAFDAVDADILELLTATLSRAIGEFARFTSAQDAAEALQRALETRAPIEQAKGMLMALHRIDADQAFQLLRRQSQTTNRRLRDVAFDLVERLSAPHPSASAETAR